MNQTEFRRAMLDPSAVPPLGLVNPDGAPATKRFDVYRNNVAVSLTEALETAFPAIQKLVGDENFKALAGVYLRRHPPSSPLMMYYGAEMPDFLAAFEPLQRYPYLGDVARLELALRHSYHAEDAAPIDGSILQELPPDRLMAARFAFAPAMQLVRSRHPIHAIWAYNMVEGAPPPEAGGQNVLVTRPEYDPHPETLPPGGGVFLSELVGGATFGGALYATNNRVDNFDLTRTLGQLLAGGAITRLIED